LRTRKLAKSFKGLNSSLAQLTSYGIAKWHKNNVSMHDFEVQYIHTPAANVLTWELFAMLSTMQNDKHWKSNTRHRISNSATNAATVIKNAIIFVAAVKERW